MIADISISGQFISIFHLQQCAPVPSTAPGICHLVSFLSGAYGLSLPETQWIPFILIHSLLRLFQL